MKLSVVFKVIMFVKIKKEGVMSALADITPSI
jgi:hypothetical protein